MADEIEVSLIIKALAEGFDKLGDDLGGIGKAADTATPKVEKTGLSLTDLKSGIDLAKEAANAFTGVMQQAFEMGKEGATITATADSLTHLAGEAGYAGDLIGDLEKAAGGTVDDLDYMGSTIRLLTGETGDFANRLASAAPELLTMARAAVKLNPTLGDTATAYEAITKAIETGQVRALKDYGIVIEATGTKEERLQEILDKMPGLMEQVGGSVETATDKYAKFEMAVDNVKDGLSQTVDEMLNLEAATKATQAFADYLDISNQIEAAYKAGNITLEERNKLIFEHDYLLQGAEETMTKLNTAILSNNGALDYASLATQEVADAERDWAENTFYAQQAQDGLRTSVAANTGALYALQAANESLAGSLNYAGQMTSLLNDVLIVQGDTYSENNQRVLDYLLITGEITQAEYEDAVAKNKQVKALETLNTALAGNMITMEQWQEIMKDGKITTEEMTGAVTELWGAFLDRTLEVAASDAEEMAQAMGDVYESGNEVLDTFGPVYEVMLETGKGLEMLTEDAGPLQGTLSDLAVSGADAALAVDDLANAAEKAAGNYKINIEVDVTGDEIPNVGGYSGGVPTGQAPPQAKAMGGAVAPNSVYLVGEQGPELFVPNHAGTIVPAGQTAEMMGGGAQIIQLVVEGRVLAEVLNPYLGNQARLAQANGAGRYGR